MKGSRPQIVALREPMSLSPIGSDCAPANAYRYDERCAFRDILSLKRRRFDDRSQ